MAGDASLERRVSALAERAGVRDADYKRRNRVEMPESAAFLDSLRQAGMTPAWGRFTENGRTVEFGQRVSRSIPPMPHFVLASGVAGLLQSWRERANSRRKG